MAAGGDIEQVADKSRHFGLLQLNYTRPSPIVQRVDDFGQFWPIELGPWRGRTWWNDAHSRCGLAEGDTYRVLAHDAGFTALQPTGAGECRRRQKITPRACRLLRFARQRTPLGPIYNSPRSKAPTVDRWNLSSAGYLVEPMTNIRPVENEVVLMRNLSPSAAPVLSVHWRNMG